MNKLQFKLMSEIKKNPVLILFCPYMPPSKLVKPFKFSCRSHVGDPETTFILNL
jgi:hypothetical protein